MRDATRLTMEQATARWPRLYAAMRWASILTDGEAAGCLRDWPRQRDLPRSHHWGTEAVMHAGGPGQVLRHAIACRRAARLCYRSTLLHAAAAQCGGVLVVKRTNNGRAWATNLDDRERHACELAARAGLLVRSHLPHPCAPTNPHAARVYALPRAVNL